MTNTKIRRGSGMKFKFTKAKWLIDYQGIWLTLQVPNNLKEQVQEFILGIKNSKDGLIYECKINPHRQKRSLNANAYCWALINEMANVLRASKEEIYLNMLKRYGQSSVVSVIEEAAGTFKKSVKYCEEIGQAELNGKAFKHIKVYAGSSTYDSREMAILIDGVISECKDLDIETMTPGEIEKMKGAWGNAGVDIVT